MISRRRIISRSQDFFFFFKSVRIGRCYDFLQENLKFVYEKIEQSWLHYFRKFVTYEVPAKFNISSDWEIISKLQGIEENEV